MQIPWTPFQIFLKWKKGVKQGFYLFLPLAKMIFSSLPLTIFTALELTREKKKTINTLLTLFLLADELSVSRR